MNGNPISLNDPMGDDPPADQIQYEITYETGDCQCSYQNEEGDYVTEGEDEGQIELLKLQEGASTEQIQKIAKVSNTLSSMRRTQFSMEMWVNAYKSDLDDMNDMLVGTVFAEGRDMAMWEAFTWVYYNLVIAHGEYYDYDNGKVGGYRGLERSSAFRKKDFSFKVAMVVLGHDEYRDDAAASWMRITENGKVRRAKTIGEYVDTHDFSHILAIKNHLIETVIEHQDQNPYPNFQNQGNVGDLNRTYHDTFDPARTYFWLQKDKKVKNTYVYEFRNNTANWTSFVIYEAGIQSYFKKNPKLYKKGKAPLYDDKTFDKKK